MKDIQCSPFENLQPQNPEANIRRLIGDLAKSTTTYNSHLKEKVLTIAETVAKELPNIVNSK